MVECSSLVLLSIKVVGFYRTLHSSAGSETHFLTDPCSEGRLVLMIQLKKTNSLECLSIITVTVCEVPSLPSCVLGILHMLPLIFMACLQSTQHYFHYKWGSTGSEKFCNFQRQLESGGARTLIQVCLCDKSTCPFRPPCHLRWELSIPWELHWQCG